MSDQYSVVGRVMVSRELADQTGDDWGPRVHVRIRPTSPDAVDVQVMRCPAECEICAEACQHKAKVVDAQITRPRLRACVEAWPGAVDGEYNPSCCRFPKSCSASTYDPKRVADADLERPL